MEANDVAQWLGCLPNMHEALGVTRRKEKRKCLVFI
jgi:hypothetical protein